ncbi:uncharacterized protein LOC125778329 [Bactrocera dorsalis]|uniref:Uncharacterized protein LOC125778329 n=1 Tax=Bactrocera dorsalis TaxID=27457 RepID=A0ABM3JPY1_BACDO|nr:uncharacterized protein LOC125778329 [Bactrocera dorsalis]XP_049311305.1 uncharacterized protein LOC125778329 [Bactrocera dorsalis]
MESNTEIQKQNILNALSYKCILDITANDSSSDEEDDDILIKFAIDAALIIANRRSTHLGIPKSSQWVNNVLPRFDSGRMRQMLRIEFFEFNYILSLIKQDPVFQNKNFVSQLPIDLQLKITLFRLGSSGESASIRKIATLFGIGDGGTVTKVTERVITALINLKSTFLCWPSREERRKIVTKTMKELPGCIGYVDGTEIRLAESPSKDHELYFSRKKQYAIKMQVVCDYSLRIRQATIGYRGSVHDAKIFAESAIGKNPQNYFCHREWIAGDSAYPLSQHLITPFRQNSTEQSKEMRDTFNQYFSKYRVRIENCFGKLKEKFCSLKELRFRLTNETNYKNYCRWILACCILHNMLLQFNLDENPSLESQEETDFPQEIYEHDDLRKALSHFVNNKDIII